MNSIRWKLLRANLVIVATLYLAGLGFFIMHLVVVENYKKISQNMIEEYQLIDLTSNLIVAYNARFHNINVADPQSEQTIANIYAQIDALIKDLDEDIVNKDSVVSYIGLKNTITSVRTEIDAGLAILRTGNVSNISAHYDAAIETYDFVKDNGAQLIMDELKYSQSIQQRNNTLYNVSTIVAVIVFLLTGVGYTVYIISFSKKLVDPIQKLKESAEQIALGNMNATIDEDLLKRTDEIGSLSKSYHTMIQKLVDSISKLTTTSKTLESSNAELEQMNKFMVGRELRMEELKKMNADLAKKLEQHSVA